MQYRREIDGLRALAVIPVILFHAGMDVFAGGYVGVDIFFVISGYLITTILMEDMQSGNFSFARFYERRARRILPALIFVILFCMPFAWIILSPYDFKEFSQSIFSISIFSSNVFFYLKSGYFDAKSELKPLIHTWSLSVEEQYYLIFPVLLVITWRFGIRKNFKIIIFFIILSLLFCEWGWRNQPVASYYLIPFRSWELFSGSIVAMVSKKYGRQSNNLVSVLGFLAILGSMMMFDKSTPFPSFYTLVPVLGAAAIILYANDGTAVAKLLGCKVLVGIGLISYSAYLWHQPILAFYRLYYFDEINSFLIFVVLFFTLLLAMLTWRFIELPARKFNSQSNQRRTIFLSAAFALGALAFIGYAGHVSMGFPHRNENMLRLAQNPGLSMACSGASVANTQCKSKDKPKIVVWGDSFAMHLVNALVLSFPSRGVHQLTLSSCPPVPGATNVYPQPGISCFDYNEAVSNYLMNKKDQYIETVILSSTENLASPQYESKFRLMISKLKKLGYRVVIVSPTPRFSDSEKCITQAMRGQVELNSCKFNLSEAINKQVFSDLNDFAVENKVEYISLVDFMCKQGVCYLEEDGKIILRDRGHLSNEIQPLLSGLFTPHGF